MVDHWKQILLKQFFCLNALVLKCLDFLTHEKLIHMYRI